VERLLSYVAELNAKSCEPIRASSESGMRESLTQSYTEARSLWKKFLRVILRRAGTQLFQMCLRKTERKSSIILPAPHQGRKGENARWW
jgi:hypothetical protein